jgi:hypothetical protein
MAARSQQTSSSVWWRLIHSLTKRIAVSRSLHRGRSRLVRLEQPARRIGRESEWIVIAEEHQNRDSVEGADPGHGINVPGQSDRFDREARLERITVTPRDSPTRPVSPGPFIAGGRRPADVGCGVLGRPSHPQESRR